MRREGLEVLMLRGVSCFVLANRGFAKCSRQFQQPTSSSRPAATSQRMRQQSLRSNVTNRLFLLCTSSH